MTTIKNTDTTALNAIARKDGVSVSFGYKDKAGKKTVVSDAVIDNGGKEAKTGSILTKNDGAYKRYLFANMLSDVAVSE